MKQIFHLLLATLFMLSCKHEAPVICKIDGEEFTREKSIQQMKDYLLFDVGTYWIYEEETTGALDTVTVYYSWEGIAQEVNEAFRMEAHSTLEGYDYYYTFNESLDNECITQENCLCYPVKRTKGKPGEFVGASNNFLFPAIMGNFIYVLGGGIIEVENKINSITINDNTFIKTIVFRTDNNLSENDQETRFWVSDHIGIIKKELIGLNEIWSLKEYDIIQ